jgi:hypothetical protein
MDRIAETSPRFKARTAGVSQLLEAVTATFGQVIVIGRLVVSGNATATAANIVGHEQLFWLGFASSLMGVAFHIAWALLMYVLLKPVNRSLSLLAAFFSLVSVKPLRQFIKQFTLVPHVLSPSFAKRPDNQAEVLARRPFSARPRSPHKRVRLQRSVRHAMTPGTLSRRPVWTEYRHSYRALSRDRSPPAGR